MHGRLSRPEATTDTREESPMSKNRRRQQQAQVSEQATVTSSDIMTPAEIAAERAMLLEQARRDLEAPAAPAKPTRPTKTYAAGQNKRQGAWGPVPNPNSIRQIIRRLLVEGKTTKEIGEVIKAEHPDSMAARKVTQHVAFYRSKMRKAGELPRKA